MAQTIISIILKVFCVIRKMYGEAKKPFFEAETIFYAFANVFRMPEKIIRKCLAIFASYPAGGGLGQYVRLILAYFVTALPLIQLHQQLMNLHNPRTTRKLLPKPISRRK
jgi:hypothetical protein